MCGPAESRPSGARAELTRRLGTLLLAALGIGSCSGDRLSGPSTGLVGTAVRGPITPVCQIDVPCSAPFSAGFTVWQRSRPIASFRSDGQGRFTVRLEPGTYTIIPAPDAPILDPQGQGKSVFVGPSGLTTIALEFDTGIR